VSAAVAEIFVNHFSDARHPDGAPLPAPFEVWDLGVSEMDPPRSLEDPARPARWKYTVSAPESAVIRHTDSAAHRGALGVIPQPLVPIKVDRWDAGIDFWVTEWHTLEGF
jgi:hypothetical protein